MAQRFLYLVTVTLLALPILTGCGNRGGSTSASQSMGVRGGSTDLPTVASANSHSGQPVKPRVPIHKIDTSGIQTKSYTVESGDTLWKIARKHNTNARTIKALNNIIGDLIQPGQTLKVPASGGVAPGTSMPESETESTASNSLPSPATTSTESYTSSQTSETSSVVDSYSSAYGSQ